MSMNTADSNKHIMVNGGGGLERSRKAEMVLGSIGATLGMLVAGLVLVYSFMQNVGVGAGAYWLGNSYTLVGFLMLGVSFMCYAMALLKAMHIGNDPDAAGKWLILLGLTSMLFSAMVLFIPSAMVIVAGIGARSGVAKKPKNE